ncbi:hypothetical protein JN11_02935 [Mucilaginibacter frigoritolerans]|uniref:Uncharacterized protein n=1 Tax=Mucilaginibacter frigoritolerans TaxID=652788 RepID=A0A562TYW3_9SPHI|nr:hypothetical protein [Mucilaginibacter frigoritolerans]TWI98747.1 hypothetical protein JN11_02935 [Mucilaginibacter frigoritolerans]
MIYFLIVVCTFLSCYLFERISFKEQVNSLKESYQITFKLVSEKDKTELIIQQSVRQFKFIFLLFLKLIFTMAPFLIVGAYLLVRHQSVYQVTGNLYINILVVLVAVVYFLVKRYAFK